MRILPLLFLPVALAACVPTPEVSSMQAVSGDREAGVMKLSTTYDPAKKVVSATQAKQEANMRCRAWGFSHALPFEDRVKTCDAPSYDGTCSRVRITQSFQCAVK
jgi:hypothetical protein